MSTTHKAIATVAPRAPLEIRNVPTVQPRQGEVLIRQQWTASTPLDLHQADGGLLVKHPQGLGDSVGGIVAAVGPGVEWLAVGDEVFGFAFAEAHEKGQQEYVTVSELAVGKVPTGFSLQEVVTIPNNFVTAWHSVVTDFGIDLPWPKPDAPTLPHQKDPVLVWGGSSSAGQFMIELLKYYGYEHIITTSSPAHHGLLKQLGATEVFDYKEPDVLERIKESASKVNSSEPSIPLIYDPIGSQDGSVAPIAKIAEKGSTVAVLLPIVVRDASDDTTPEFTLSVQEVADWAQGVEVRGVRTHTYASNSFAKEHLQPTVMPTLLALGAIRPNKQRIVQGETLLERAEKALGSLRRKEVSGERLVWRIADA